jgi:hypothetical protein
MEEEDLDLVSGWKKKRHDPLSKTLPSAPTGVTCLSWPRSTCTT